MRKLIIILALMHLITCLNAQSIQNPNYGLKAPATAEVTRVDFNANSTVVWFTLMSDINNAYFCIDRNTYLRKPDGMKVKIQDIKVLPYCPSTYRFKKPGDKITFSMTFAATGVLPWFSVIEECGGGCLSFYGIVTDEKLNSELSNAYALSDRGEVMAAYSAFEDIINRTDSLDLGIEGAVYTNLIILDRKLGRPVTARSWYDRMMTSDAPDLQQYLDNLKAQGVTY